MSLLQSLNSRIDTLSVSGSSLLRLGSTNMSSSNKPTDNKHPNSSKIVFKPQSNPGFTIVELLIVIVVIGILAAISIVAYNGIQNRAYDNTVQSDLKGIAKGFELYKIDNIDEIYPREDLASSNPSFKYPVSKDAYMTVGNTFNLLNCVINSGRGFALVAQSKSGKYFTISSSNSNPRLVTDNITLADTTSCSVVAPGSSAYGAGYGYNAWRNWTAG